MSSIIHMISSKHFQVEQLAHGVFAAVHRMGGLAVANACIVSLGDQTLVFDTLLTPQAAVDLNLAAEALTDQPVTLVVNSHDHNDHTWGNQAFSPEADLISSEGTRKLLSSNAVDDYRWYKENLGEYSVSPSPGYPAWSAASRLEGDGLLESCYAQGIHEALPRLRLRYPNLTFESSLTLHGSERSAHLIAYSGGHTVSDTVLWLPEERILAAGDLFYMNAHPYLQEVDPRTSLLVLEELLALEPDLVLPGHGSIGTFRDLRVMQGYLGALISRAEELAHRDQPLAAVRRAKIPAPYHSWQLGSNYLSSLRRMVVQTALESGIESAPAPGEAHTHLPI